MNNMLPKHLKRPIFATLHLLDDYYVLDTLVPDSRNFLGMVDVESFNNVEAERDKYKLALEKIEDPRKRDHQEPDAYTQLGCVMNIASEALEGK